jgi:O-antigen/teichoic acid export membrane protein
VLLSGALAIINLRLGQWQVRQQAGRYACFQVLQALCNVVLSLALVVHFRYGAEGRISAQLWSAALFMVAALVLLRIDGLLPLRSYERQNCVEALTFGIPLIPHVAAFFLLNSVDRLVITANLGLAEAGIYMVAVQIASGLALIMEAANKAYVPWLFERLRSNDPAEKLQIVRLTYFVFAFLALIAGVAFLLAGTLVDIIAGPRYREAGLVLGWLVLGQAFYGMYLMVTNYVFYSRRTGLLSTVTVTSGLINVLLLLLLVSHLQLLGAALAFAIAMAARFTLTWRAAQIAHSMPWFSRAQAGRD